MPDLEHPNPGPAGPTSRVLGVVLAAGGGSRFAGRTHKLLAPFRGRPLVTHAVDACLEAGFDEVVVVEGAVDLGAVLPESVSLLHNEAWDTGQASSLRAATDYAERHGYDAVVVGLADQPLVPASAWRRVAEADGAIVVATFRGERRPPTKLTDQVWHLLPVGGDEGARSLIRSRPELVVEVACEGVAADVDTTEDLRRWS